MIYNENKEKIEIEIETHLQKEFEPITSHCHSESESLQKTFAHCNHNSNETHQTLCSTIVIGQAEGIPFLQS